MTGKNWRFDWITRWDEIDHPEFLKTWEDIYTHADNPNVFMHPALGMAWLNVYRKLRTLEPYFIIAKKGNSQVFFPLILWSLSGKNAFLKKIIPVGYSDFDYTGPIYRNLTGWDERQNFWDELTRIITLENVLKKFDQVEFTGIRDRFRLSGFKVIEERCPKINLVPIGTCESFVSTIPSKLRKDLNRRRNRLEEKGVVEFKVHSSFREIKKSFPMFMKWHALKWPDAYNAPGLYEKVIMDALQAGILNYSVLTLNKTPISIRIGFYNGDTFYSYIPVYDPQYSQYSPGKMHLLHCICWAIENKLSTFDHLRGEEHYKSEWAENSYPLYTYSLWNPGFTSSLKRMALNFKEATVPRR
jgi:hypothetical protein